jgi:hypothetical protein
VRLGMANTYDPNAKCDVCGKKRSVCRNSLRLKPPTDREKWKRAEGLEQANRLSHKAS